jgi:hypothetical protein
MPGYKQGGLVPHHSVFERWDFTSERPLPSIKNYSFIKLLYDFTQIDAS